MDDARRPSRWPSRARRDLVLISLGALALFVAGSVTEAFDASQRWLRGRLSGHEGEFVFAFAIAAVGLAVFGWLRWREARREVAARAAAESRYRSLVEQLPAITYIESDDGRTLFVSPQIETIMGFTPEEWLEDLDLWRRQLHPEDRERVLAADAAHYQPGRPFNIDYRIYAKDGRLLWLHNEAVPVLDERGLPVVWQGVVLDITERMESDERRREAETRFRTLVEQIPAITYIHAPRSGLELRYVSPQLASILGYSPKEWGEDLGLYWRRMHPDDVERVRAEDERTDETGEPFQIEYRMYARDGRLVWLRDEAVLVRDANGDPMFWQGVRFDITRQKEAEAQVREAEARFRTLVETVPAVTYIDLLDESSTTLYVSPQVEDLLGYSVQTWMNDPEPWARNLHPEDAERVLEAVRRHNERGDPYDEEYRFRAADGSWRWIRDQATIVVSEDGSRRSQGVMFEVTERHVAEDQLREAEKRYRAIVEHVPAAIYVDAPDASMVTAYVSPQIEQLMGVTQEAYTADPELWLKVMHPGDRDEMRRTYLESVRAGSTWRGEYRVLHPDGHEVWIHDETTIVADQGGKPLFVQGVMFDITERKRAEEGLRLSERREREAAERLRVLDEMKNTFLAAVSHELRSPLTSILGLSLTLQQPQVSEPDRADLQARLVANARKLDRLLSDLLDIDRLNRGIVTPRYRSVDLGGLIRRTIENLETVDRHALIVEPEEVHIEADPAKVERIVENLVANAMRHTSSETTIWVRVWAVSEGAVIAVEDDGPGIAQDLREAIFEPFRQGPTMSPHSPGTGIGLSLVARFSELHGGRAWVQDRDGGGASFRVFLPASPPVHGEAEGSRLDAVDAG